MPYDMTNLGISELYKNALDNSTTMNNIINAIQTDFVTFIKSNFNLSPEQQDLIEDMPSNIMNNIANNLVHALSNSYPINISIGNFADPSKVGAYSDMMIRCRVRITWHHIPNCTEIPFIGISCEI